MSDTPDHEGTRRDFLYYAAGGTGAVAAAGAVWPLVNQMNPSADVKALASIRVDVSGVEPGTQLTVKWLGKPVFIRRRTSEEIESARSVDLNVLPDQSAQNNNAPELDAADENRALDETGEWLVMMGVCTHLGCVPLAILMAGFAHVMDHIMIPQAVSEKALRQQICPCPLRSSLTKIQSNLGRRFLRCLEFHTITMNPNQAVKNGFTLACL